MVGGLVGELLDLDRFQVVVLWVRLLRMDEGLDLEMGQVGLIGRVWEMDCESLRSYCYFILGWLGFLDSTAEEQILRDIPPPSLQNLQLSRASTSFFFFPGLKLMIYALFTLFRSTCLKLISGQIYSTSSTFPSPFFLIFPSDLMDTPLPIDLWELFPLILQKALLFSRICMCLRLLLMILSRVVLMKVLCFSLNCWSTLLNLFLTTSWTSFSLVSISSPSIWLQQLEMGNFLNRVRVDSLVDRNLDCVWSNSSDIRLKSLRNSMGESEEILDSIQQLLPIYLLDWNRQCIIWL